MKIDSDFLFQKHKLRLQICAENMHRDREQWGATQKVINAVGADGMSGEETDEPQPRIAKSLSRVPAAWISSELPSLFAVVDTYREAFRDELFVNDTRGNKPLPRSGRSKEPTNKIPFVKGLPRNYYDNRWFQAKGEGGQEHVTQNKKKRDLPILVSLVEAFTGSHVAD